jgi:hypothetical protein
MVLAVTGIIGVYRARACLGAFCFLWCLPGTSEAQSGAQAAEAEPREGGQGGGEDKPRPNGVTLGAAYSFHILRDRDSATTGEPLRSAEHLGGFVVAYERELIPEHLALTISKPFLFSRERFDTPFDFILRGLFRKGSWEGFVGALITWNIRVFEQERAEQEGETNLMSLGVGAVIGGSRYFTDQWSLDLEVGYTYIPTDDIVEHEISAALSGVFHF